VSLSPCLPRCVSRCVSLTVSPSLSLSLCLSHQMLAALRVYNFALLLLGVLDPGPWRLQPSEAPTGWRCNVMDAVGLHGPTAARRAAGWVDVLVFALLHAQVRPLPAWAASVSEWSCLATAGGIPKHRVSEHPAGRVSTPAQAR
jgi:hypothetical protein